MTSSVTSGPPGAGSSQSSSRTDRAGAHVSSATARPRTRERTLPASGSSAAMDPPSGSVMRTASAPATTCARHSKSLAHLRGFFALATLPSSASTSAYARSRASPRSVTSHDSISSPSMDLTGYRQRDRTDPVAAGDIGALLFHQREDFPVPAFDERDELLVPDLPLVGADLVFQLSLHVGERGVLFLHDEGIERPDEGGHRAHRSARTDSLGDL